MPSIGQRTCGTIYNQEYINSLPSDVQEQIERLNQQLQEKDSDTENLQNQFSTTTFIDPNDVIFIPVVVHVVWNTLAQNISDAQICSQIQVLNEDFARSNPDAANTPGAFLGAASNPRIQFYLATVDPSGNPTTGITRTNTTITAFGQNNNVKFNASGGRNAWPANRYLNLWVTNLGLNSQGRQILGFAQPPTSLSSSPSTDGVVMHWRAFGRGTGFNLISEFNRGRTATHEVGHWLWLIHIWGPDDGITCSGSDDVIDTPNQAGSSMGVPTFPRTDNCTMSNPGIMFMNYMDYTFDIGMNMFTNGQKQRMRSNFNPGGFRANADYAVATTINNNLAICTNRTLTLNNAPPGAVVTWTSSNTSRLTINSTTGVATRQNNYTGNVTVTATLNTGCGTIAIQQSMKVGNAPSGSGSVNSNCSGSSFNVLNTSLSGVCTANSSINFVFNLSDPQYSNFNFTPVSVPSGASWSTSGRILTIRVTAPSTQGQRSATVGLSATGPCGPYNVNFTATAINISSSWSFSIAPNPTQDDVTVTVNNEEILSNDYQSLIYSIRIIDSYGTIGQTFEYKDGISSATIPLQKFNAGLYTLSVFDGKSWSSKKLIIEK
jgi:hypothetical protein